MSCYKNDYLLLIKNATHSTCVTMSKVPLGQTWITAHLFHLGTLSPASQGGTMLSLSSLWLFAALPGLLWASHVSTIVEGDNDPSRICKPAPHWEINGNAPMQELLGNVVVVALLKAS